MSSKLWNINIDIKLQFWDGEKFYTEEIKKNIPIDSKAGFVIKSEECALNYVEGVHDFYVEEI